MFPIAQPPPQMPMSPAPQEGGLNPILMMLIQALLGGSQQTPQPEVPFPQLGLTPNDPTALAQRVLNGRDV